MRTIHLERNYGRLANREPFLLPNELKLKFDHVGYDLSNAFITLKNGLVKEKYKFTNPFIVDKKFLFTGRLFAKLDMYIGDKKVKSWDCLPIEIKETDEAVIAWDLLSLLEKEIKELKENCVPKTAFNELLSKYNVLVDKHNELTETVMQIKENY